MYLINAYVFRWIIIISGIRLIKWSMLYKKNVAILGIIAFLQKFMSSVQINLFIFTCAVFRKRLHQSLVSRRYIKLGIKSSCDIHYSFKDYWFIFMFRSLLINPRFRLIITQILSLYSARLALLATTVHKFIVVVTVENVV